jgi:hypothetical protein
VTFKESRMSKKGKTGVLRRREAKRAQRRRRGGKPSQTIRPGSTAEAMLMQRSFKKGGLGGLEGMLPHALMLMCSGRLSDADRVLMELKRQRPNLAEIRGFRAAVRALAGDFSGMVWPDLRRVYLGQLTQYRCPVWDGSRQPGKRLLVWDTCSGYGDTFQLVRLMDNAKRQFQGELLLGIPPGTSRLFRSLAGPDVLVEPPFDDAAAASDFHCPIDYLPALPGCGWTRETFAAVPYLFAEDELVQAWVPTFPDRRLTHIGLHFQPDQNHFTGSVRTVPLDTLAPLFDVPGTRFYSLQRGASAEVAAFPKVRDLGEIDAPGERFVQTAAVLMHFDLVICADSAIGHLAGACGVKAWVILDSPSDPRWGLKTMKTVFYPEHRLYRQPGLLSDDWEGAIEWVKEDLEKLVQERKAS